MAGKRTLRVVRSSSDAPEEGDTFVVESALQEVPTMEFERIFRKLSEAEFDRVAGLPLYQAIRLNLAFLFSQNRNPPMAATHLIVLHRLLDERLSEGDYDIVRCTGLDEQYRAVVSDVATGRDVEVEGVDRFDFGFHRVLHGLLVGVWGYLLILADQLFSIVYRTLKRSRIPDPTKIAFVPHVNRFDCTRPVLDELDEMGVEHEVVLPTTTVTWLRERDGRYADVAPYDPTPLDAFAELPDLVTSLRRLSGLVWSVAVTRSFGRDLRAFFADDFGVDAPDTLSYLLEKTLATQVPTLANVTVAERVVEELDPDSVVVGSLGFRQEALLYPALESGIDAYHVPHSVPTGYELFPPAGTVHFVPGEHVIEYMNTSEQTSDTSNLVAAGRPKLLSLARTDPTPRTDWEPDAVRIVVATQPFHDSVREEFVQTVLDGVAEVPVPVDVVIKLHPNEDVSFYRRTLSERPFRVRITKEDLHGYLSSADLTVTINSNVGLESMVLGTPCVCVALWTPLIRPRLYATEGPVPVLESPDAVGIFFSDVDGERVAKLRTEQRTFVDERYLHSDVVGEIAGIIAADQRLPTDESEVAVDRAGGTHEAS